MSLGIFLLVITLTISAWTDLRERRIYNKVLMPSLIFAIMLHFGTSGLLGLKNSLIGMSIGFLLLILPYILGGLGAGDVKLLAVVGAYGGPQFAFYAFLFTAVIGGIVAIGILLYKKSLKATVLGICLILPLLKFKTAFSENSDMKEGIPYAIPIALGSMITLLTIDIGF